MAAWGARWPAGGLLGDPSTRFGHGGPDRIAVRHFSSSLAWHGLTNGFAKPSHDFLDASCASQIGVRQDPNVGRDLRRIDGGASERGAPVSERGAHEADADACLHQLKHRQRGISPPPFRRSLTE